MESGEVLTVIKIRDDFDLAKIADSGQCFRAAEIQDGWFRFITSRQAIHIKKIDAETFQASCSAQEWEGIWKNYFDLGENYSAIREEIFRFSEKFSFGEKLSEAAEVGKGIRILRQEPFETLISFIVSQRKTIPAIRKSIELICEKFGETIRTDFGDVKIFPTVAALSKATTLELSACALGYRGAYVRDAIEKVQERIVRLDDLQVAPDDQIIAELKFIKGVGEKIANCVALYAYHRMNLAPVDVWIQRAIDEDFGGRNIFAEFGANAGILQQYIFFNKRLGEKIFELTD